MSGDYAVGHLARADIRELLAWSHASFGSDVRDGYEELIFTAFLDVASDATRVGVKDRSDLGDGVKTWHLALSKGHVDTRVRRIRKPRHIVFFRVVGDIVHIVRVLHDAMEHELRQFD